MDTTSIAESSDPEIDALSATDALEILVLSYDSSVVISRLLASLAAVVPEVPVSILEHSDSPGAVERLQQVSAAHTARVRLSSNPSNPGFGAGCNALAKTSTARHLLFLNPDTELVTWPYSHGLPPQGRLIGPLMVDSGEPSRHYGTQYRIRDEMCRSWLRRPAPRPDGSGFVSGAALLIAKSDFDRIGGFDESYFLYYEDIDLCLRANAAHIGTSVDDRFTVRHAGAHSTSGRFGASLIWSYESAVRFHRSHGSSISAYRCYVALDSALRATVAVVAQHDRRRARAYGALARRSLNDLFSKGRRQGSVGA